MGGGVITEVSSIKMPSHLANASSQRSMSNQDEIWISISPKFWDLLTRERSLFEKNLYMQPDVWKDWRKKYSSTHTYYKTTSVLHDSHMQAICGDFSMQPVRIHFQGDLQNNQHSRKQRKTPDSEFPRPRIKRYSRKQLLIITHYLSSQIPSHVTVATLT